MLAGVFVSRVCWAYFDCLCHEDVWPLRSDVLVQGSPPLRLVEPNCVLVGCEALEPWLIGEVICAPIQQRLANASTNGCRMNEQVVQETVGLPDRGKAKNLLIRERNQHLLILGMQIKVRSLMQLGRTPRESRVA